MRWMIASVAFVVPVLVAIHFAAAGVGDLPEAAIGSAGLAELRAWTVEKREILERYAPHPGQPESANLPHLALDRFDRSGCDPLGNPWFRLANRPAGVSCGVLRRLAIGKPVAPAGNHGERILLLRLAGDWQYWEWREQASPAERAPSSP